MRGRLSAAGRVALAALLTVAAGPAGAQGAARAPDGWFGADKARHFFMSFFTQSVAYSAVRATGAAHGSSLWMASTVTAAVGVGKEWHDRRTTGVSVRDLAWDAAGAGAATLLLRRTIR